MNNYINNMLETNVINGDPIRQILQQGAFPSDKIFYKALKKDNLENIIDLVDYGANVNAKHCAKNIQSEKVFSYLYKMRSMFIHINADIKEEYEKINKLGYRNFQEKSTDVDSIDIEQYPISYIVLIQPIIKYSDKLKLLELSYEFLKNIKKSMSSNSFITKVNHNNIEVTEIIDGYRVVTIRYKEILNINPLDEYQSVPLYELLYKDKFLDTNLWRKFRNNYYGEYKPYYSRERDIANLELLLCFLNADEAIWTSDIGRIVGSSYSLDVYFEYYIYQDTTNGNDEIDILNDNISNCDVNKIKVDLAMNIYKDYYSELYPIEIRYNPKNTPRHNNRLYFDPNRLLSFRDKILLNFIIENDTKSSTFIENDPVLDPDILDEMPTVNLSEYGIISSATLLIYPEYKK